MLGASQRDWLPQVFLKGSIGYSSHDLKDLTKRNSMTFEIAPSISWTLFSGTKLVNATRLARAQLDESIHQFNQTVLTAVQETDNAMNSYRNSIQQIVAMREVCNQGEENAKALPRFVQTRAYSLPERTGRTTLTPDIRKSTGAGTRQLLAASDSLIPGIGRRI